MCRVSSMTLSSTFHWQNQNEFSIEMQKNRTREFLLQEQEKENCRELERAQRSEQEMKKRLEQLSRESISQGNELYEIKQQHQWLVYFWFSWKSFPVRTVPGKTCLGIILIVVDIYRNVRYMIKYLQIVQKNAHDVVYCARLIIPATHFGSFTRLKICGRFLIFVHRIIYQRSKAMPYTYVKQGIKLQNKTKWYTVISCVFGDASLLTNLHKH